MFMHTLKTQNRLVTQILSKWRLNFALSCHIDLTRDQNDVQHLSILVNVLCKFSISGTVPTLGTACTGKDLVLYVVARGKGFQVPVQ